MPWDVFMLIVNEVSAHYGTPYVKAGRVVKTALHEPEEKGDSTFFRMKAAALNKRYKIK
jgi:hypothetical protein